MNIMGILSVFSVAVAGFIIDRTAGAPAQSALAVIWRQSGPLVAAGAFAALVAAFLFYRERSLLAWYAGQIALAEVRNDEAKRDELLVDADAWDTWINYRVAFLCLYASFLWVGTAAARQIFPILVGIRQRWLITVPTVILLAVSMAIRHFLTKYRLEDDSPWKWS